MRVAVVGAGWAGLAAAVEATRAGHRVVLDDMAPQPGGRGRGAEWDCGQHLLIGAYTRTLALLRDLGVAVDAVLWRQPLALQYPDGRGLALPAGAPTLAFLRGVLAARGWRPGARLALLGAATRWLLAGFTCAEDVTVDALCARMPAPLRRDFIDPLCVAALNTPPSQASGQVFLRVLHDALFSGPGGSDLLLPRVGLSALLPDPAVRWLRMHGAHCRWRRRATALRPAAGGWLLDGERFDAVILACSAVEAARLVGEIAPAWRRAAAAIEHHAILSVYLHDRSLRLAQPLTLLASGADSPAQFALDLGRLGRGPATHAFVVSAADALLADGVAAAAQVVLAQARRVFAGAFRSADALRHAAAERRATFACTAGLVRPPRHIAPGLLAAGDYVAGAYPATLEGAVRSGIAAAQALT
jgi:squalene-associated FAD-dependent desaturase